MGEVSPELRLWSPTPGQWMTVRMAVSTATHAHDDDLSSDLRFFKNVSRLRIFGELILVRQRRLNEANIRAHC